MSKEILGNFFIVEDAARLDYITDKVAKRTEEISSHAEYEVVQIWYSKN